MKTPNIENILNLAEEIKYLQKSHELLIQISTYLSPYDHKINGKDVDWLPSKIHEHLNGFDDGE